MYRTTGKFVALILAIWLPLFSGNALSMSVAMQRGDCHSVVAQQGEPCDPAMQQDTHHVATDPTQSTSYQDSVGNECVTCHLACCGYLAAVLVKVTDAQSSALRFLPVSALFYSFTTAPLDPPPLART